MPKAGTDLDRALDELYGTAPSAFTKARDALAKQLKGAGDAAAATTVKGLRKPTAIAYVLNQLARRYADDLGDLVDVGRQLARAQRKALRGEAGDDLREAIARQRTVVGQLTAKTATLMKELEVSPTGHLDEIAGALQAALVDPAVGAQLEEGRLEKVPEKAAGFLDVGVGPAQAADDAKDARDEAKAKAHAKETASADAKAKAKAEAKERAAQEKRARMERAAELVKESERLAEEAKRAKAVAEKAVAEKVRTEAAAKRAKLLAQRALEAARA